MIPRKLRSLWTGLLVCLFLYAWACPADGQSRVDIYGDPLPEGALARLGSTRLRFSKGARPLAFSPDNKRLLVVAEKDRILSLDLNNIASAEELMDWKVGILVESAPDGQLIAYTKLWKDVVTLWDTSTKKEALTLRASEGARAKIIKFSPDGRRIACVWNDHTVRVYDVATGKEMVRLEGGRKVLDIDFSPNNRTLAIACESKYVFLWDTVDDKVYELQGHPSTIWSLAFSRDGSTLASFSRTASGGGGIVILWDVETRKKAKELKNPKGNVDPIAMSPTTDWLAWGLKDGRIQIWDAEEGKILHTLVGHAGEIRTLVFSPDGKMLASGSKDGATRIWDATTGKDMFPVVTHMRNVTSLAFSQDGKSVITGSYDRTVRLWDLTTCRQTMLLSGHEEKVRAVAMSQFAGAIVTAEGRFVSVWELESGKLRKRFPVSRTSVNDLAFVPGQTTFAATAGTREGGQIRFWDSKEFTEKKSVEAAKGSTVWDLDISADGKTMVSGGSYREVYVWHMNPELRGRMQRIRLKVDDDEWNRDIRKVAISRNGTIAATCSGKSVLVLWDARTGKRIRIVYGQRTGDGRGTQVVGGIGLNPDGTVLAWNKGSELHFHDVKTGRNLGIIPAYGRGTIGHVAFSPNERILASARGTTVLLWDVDAFTTGKPTLKGDDLPREAYDVQALKNLIRKGGELEIVKYPLPNLAEDHPLKQHFDRGRSLIMASKGKKTGILIVFNRSTGQPSGGPGPGLHAALERKDVKEALSGYVVILPDRWWTDRLENFHKGTYPTILRYDSKVELVDRKTGGGWGSDDGPANIAKHLKQWYSPAGSSPQNNSQKK